MQNQNEEFDLKRKEMLKLIEPYENYLLPGLKSQNHSAGEAWKRLRESISWAEDAIKIDILTAKKKATKE